MFVPTFAYAARLAKLRDGDTFWATIDCGFRAKTTQLLRIARVNTPEMTINGLPNPSGQAAKDFVLKCIENQDLIIVTSKSDSWDRWLAEVYFTETGGIQKNLSDILLAAGHAVLYRRR